MRVLNEASGEFMVGQNRLHRSGHARGIARRDNQCAHTIGHDFGDSSHRCGYYRNSRGHGLQQRVWRAFAPRRQHRNVGQRVVRRNRRLLSLEEGVRRITSELADFMGLKSKGRIAPGMDADLVLFDPTTVKQLPAEWVNDLPGGKPRLIERSEGVEYTIVGGEVLLAHNEYQGGRPGQVVKSTVV